MLLGFIHGVMNTDNKSVSGETIDYGPCAFMEAPRLGRDQCEHARGSCAAETFDRLTALLEQR
jgi:hypothetical protein